MDDIQILATSQHCNEENLLTIAKGDDSRPACARCQHVLLSYVTVNGYIYILSNPRMNGLLKIGFSARPVEERMAELSSATGVPAPFELEAIFLSTDPEGHEKQTHTRLAPHRVKGKEFFELPVLEALEVTEAICGRPPAFLNERNPSTALYGKRKLKRTWNMSLREKLRAAEWQKRNAQRKES